MSTSLSTQTTAATLALALGAAFTLALRPPRRRRPTRRSASASR